MRELSDADRIHRFMRRLGRAARGPATVYLTGGATAVLQGWRRTTVDVDLKIMPDRDEVLRAIPQIKEELSINVELAAPDQFLPPVPGWEDRSEFIAREGELDFRHYDYYAQALAKLERGHRQDVEDVAHMRGAGKVDPQRLLRLFEQIVPELYRYPAIDPGTLRRVVEAFVIEGQEGQATDDPGD